MKETHSIKNSKYRKTIFVIISILPLLFSQNISLSSELEIKSDQFGEKLQIEIANFGVFKRSVVSINGCKIIIERMTKRTCKYPTSRLSRTMVVDLKEIDLDKSFVKIFNEKSSFEFTRTKETQRRADYVLDHINNYREQRHISSLSNRELERAQTVSLETQRIMNQKDLVSHNYDLYCNGVKTVRVKAKSQSVPLLLKNPNNFDKTLKHIKERCEVN